MSKKTTDTETALPPAAVPITKVVFANPLSKGNLGKTTFYEYLITVLERHGIRWAAANLDARHRAFQERHPERVTNLFREGVQPVDEYLPIFTAARRSTASVYLIDQRAQADRNFIEAAQQTGFLSQAPAEGIAVVGVCVALDDYEYIQNLCVVVKELAEQGVQRWLLVNHPKLVPNHTFRRTPAFRLLEALGAVPVEVPWVSNLTFNRLASLSAQNGGAVSFADAIAHPTMQRGDSALNRAELEHAIMRMEKQFRHVASFLLPDGMSFGAPTTEARSRAEVEEEEQRLREEFARAFTA